jgi:UPF0755 protein
MRNKGIALSFAGFILLIIAVWLPYQNALSKSVVQETQLFEIVKGEGLGVIAKKLTAQGIPIDPFWFRCYALQKNISNKLKAGEYELVAGMTLPQLLTIFAEGKAKKYAITFPEGFSLNEVLQQIAVHPNVNKTLSKDDVGQISSWLGISQKNPEGWFFPDTYYFEKNATDVSILKRAYEKMQSVLKEEWQNKAEQLPYKSEYEALIMASIVEKETGIVSERAKIAGVFTRRLEKGMLLQTDPTVIYGMGDSYKGNIRAKDLTTKTPYNTYVISGLPPTPIAMPGRDAIHAVLHPDKADNLYFVAKGDGSHQFSASLSDHNQAVNVFQKHRNGR